MGERPEVRVGVVGYGIMGKAHSYGYRVATSPAFRTPLARLGTPLARPFLMMYIQVNTNAVHLRL